MWCNSVNPVERLVTSFSIGRLAGTSSSQFKWQTPGACASIIFFPIFPFLISFSSRDRDSQSANKFVSAFSYVKDEFMEQMASLKEAHPKRSSQRLSAAEVALHRAR
eukprot:GHVN01029066.1.p1 GENE.GHVN01029066.1~~GHVN01029066.1.p1  ORF type:complete len:107 (+),score=9.13 GHVN01029066.1:181-501(+)